MICTLTEWYVRKWHIMQEQIPQIHYLSFQSWTPQLPRETLTQGREKVWENKALLISHIKILILNQLRIYNRDKNEIAYWYTKSTYLKGLNMFLVFTNITNFVFSPYKIFRHFWSLHYLLFALLVLLLVFTNDADVALLMRHILMHWHIYVIFMSFS